MWCIVAMILPVGIVGALLSRVGFPDTGNIAVAATPAIVNDRYSISILCTPNDSLCQVQYINRIPLTVPSLLLYRMRQGAGNIDGHELLGRIGTTGEYRFALSGKMNAGKDRGEAFILYDFIHQKVTDTIKF